MSHPYADRILTRFAGLYGAQKVASMFGITQAEIDASKDLWERQLRGCDPEAINRALRLLEQTPREWPPNLTEWVGLCRQELHHVQMSRQGALPAPKFEPTDFGRDQLRQLLATVGAEDPMFWAKRPKSALAVETLVRGAQHDNRLAAILKSHLDTGGEHCRTEQAKRAIIKLAQERERQQTYG